MTACKLGCGQSAIFRDSIGSNGALPSRFSAPRTTSRCLSKYSSPFRSEGGCFSEMGRSNEWKSPRLSQRSCNLLSVEPQAAAAARNAPFRPPALVPATMSTRGSTPIVLASFPYTPSMRRSRSISKATPPIQTQRLTPPLIIIAMRSCAFWFVLEATLLLTTPTVYRIRTKPGDFSTVISVHLAPDFRRRSLSLA
jgi:hypothetical protein